MKVGPIGHTAPKTAGPLGPNGPYRVPKAAKLPVGHPARTAHINKQIANLGSGNPQRQKAGGRNLAAMNLTPAEKRYVHIEAAKRGPAGPHGPTNPPEPSIVRQQVGPHGSGAIGLRASRNDQAVATGFVPDYLHGVGRLAEDLGKPLFDAGNAIIHGRRFNEREMQDQRTATQTGWQLTGIPTLEHPIRSGVTNDAFALAGIIPVGKLGRLAKLGDLTKTAEVADEAAQGGRVSRALASRRAAKAAIRGPARTDEAAAAHVLETAKRAKQQGFGRMLPKVPLMKPGEVSAATGGEPGRMIREGLAGNLGKLRNEQEAERAVERSQRAGAIERASAGKTGLARHIAAKQALEGKLPAGSFGRFEGITPSLRDEAINHIYEHPHFQPYEKVRATDALDQAIAGKVPTQSDQKLLERAFGKEQADGMMAALKEGGLKQKFANIMGVPRSLMASADISAPFRQGLVVMAHRPQLFFSEFRPMLKSLKSEGDFQNLMSSIHAMPTFPMMEKAKLALTDIGDTAKGVENLNAREEQFVSNIAEQIPGAGRIVRGSDRAYVGFLNKTRADLFNTLVHQAASSGYHLTDKAVEDIAKFVNSATGRGDIGALANHTATMNALFFSPRLLMSRLNFLNPLYYARLSPFARHQAMLAAGRLAGTLGLVLFTAKMAGARVNDDPRNADFGKIRIGNTRIDIAGGFQQPMRLAAQLATGEIVSSTSGRLEHLTGGFAGSSRLDVLQQFLTGKLAPVPGMAVDMLKGHQFSGQPLDWSLNPLDSNSEIMGHLTPLSLQDALNTGQQSHSLAAGLGGGLLSSVGVGVQSYSPQAANSPGKIRDTTKKELAKLQQEEHALGVPPQWRHVYGRGVRVQVQRDLAKKQARKMSQTGKITQAESYKITMQTLLKARMMTPSQYKAAVAAVPNMTDRELKHWEDEAWNHFGPGLLLEKLHHYYNVKTG